MKIAELKEHLRRLNKPVSGTKGVLQERLKAALEETPVSLNVGGGGQDPIDEVEIKVLKPKKASTAAAAKKNTKAKKKEEDDEEQILPPDDDDEEDDDIRRGGGRVR